MERAKIQELDQATIDQIAAGEVVERPASVAKELVENAIDAGATAVTVEIKDGGSTMIRVTDNGSGIEKEEIQKAFLRHSTSKIRNAGDLNALHSLGFRGEALSSIAAVSKVEVITKTKEAFVGTNYVIHGSKEVSFNDIGAPDGTTFFVRQLFYNTPARRKFLKSPMTEGNYISEMMERLALSHPDVAFRFISNNKEKLKTAGSGSLKDAIYEIYGRQIVTECLEIKKETSAFTLHGYIGTPAINRGNRLFESFFVNKRYVVSKLLQRAIEDGYTGFLMQHQYPFAVLFLDFADGVVDVNVHPTKQDVRFHDEAAVFEALSDAVHKRLKDREDVARVPLVKEEAPVSESLAGAEPFETKRLVQMKEQIAASIAKDSPYTSQYGYRFTPTDDDITMAEDAAVQAAQIEPKEGSKEEKENPPDAITYEQSSFLSEEARERHRIVGQVFGTYWIIEYGDKMYIIDQHAAHEKVLFERFMRQLKDKQMTSQQLSPPVVVTLSERETAALEKHRASFLALGYEVEAFGGREYAITAIPGNLYHIDARDMFMEAIALCVDIKDVTTEDIVTERVASISCKAAVKGNHKLSLEEVDALIGELLTLDNPYHCPHGRPTIIAMTKYELDKKFKRIL